LATLETKIDDKMIFFNGKIYLIIKYLFERRTEMSKTEKTINKDIVYKQSIKKNKRNLERYLRPTILKEKKSSKNKRNMERYL